MTRIGADIELYYTDTARLLARGSRKRTGKSQRNMHSNVWCGWVGRTAAEENWWTQASTQDLRWAARQKSVDFQSGDVREARLCARESFDAN